MKQKTVTIHEDQNEWIEENHLNLSSFIREQLEGLIEEKSRPERDRETVHRLHIEHIAEPLVYATDYGDADYPYGKPRSVCFNADEWGIETGNAIHITYGREKDIDGYPPILTDVESVDVIEESASSDFLPGL